MRSHFRLFHLAAALVAVAPWATVVAQTIVAPDVGSPSIRGSGSIPRSSTNAAPASSIDSMLEGGLPLLRTGPLAYRPHISYGIQRGTGIQAEPGIQADTTTQTISAGLLVEIGEHWHLDGTQDWTHYSNPAFKNSSDQSASLVGAYDYDEWEFSFTGNYNSSHPSLVDLARQTHEVRYGAGVQVSRQLKQRTSLDVSFDQNVRKATPVIPDSAVPQSTLRDWSSNDSIRYQITPRTSASAGLGFGESNPSDGPGMSFTRPELRLTWLPTDRITFNGSAGFETRQVRGEHGGKLRSPTYSAGVRYRPFEATTVYVEARREMSLAYFANQVTKTTSWRTGVEQRFLAVLFGSASLSQQTTRYVQTIDDTSVLRRDRYTTIDTRLSVPFLHRGSAAVFYQRSRNASSGSDFSFTSSQYGADLAFRF